MPVGVSAYVPLANVTLSASAASVTFSSISQAYRDLLLVVSAKNTAGAANLRIQFNGDTGSNYTYVLMQGDGSTAVSTTGTLQYSLSGENYTTDSMQIINIMDYSATDKHKSLLIRSDRAGGATIATATRWANIAAIASFAIFPGANSFAAGSTFALYGVAA